jgi:hypothetical protein
MERDVAANLKHVLFTTSEPTHNQHFCAIAFNERRAITYRHGPHSSLEKGQTILLHNVVDPTESIEVCF